VADGVHGPDEQENGESLRMAKLTAGVLKAWIESVGDGD